MDEYPNNTRPSKRRKVAIEANEQNPAEEQPRTTRSSARNRRATTNTTANGVEQNADGKEVEKAEPLRRSTRQPATKGSIDDVNSQANGTATPAPAPGRTRGRPRKDAVQVKQSVADQPSTAISDPSAGPVKRKRGRPRKNTVEVEQASPEQPSASVLAPAAVPARKRGRPRKDAAKPEISPADKPTAPKRSGRKVANVSKSGGVVIENTAVPKRTTTKSMRQDKTVWDVPTDSEGEGRETEDDEDQLLVDGSAAATQLQQELQDIYESVEVKELPAYAQGFKAMCEDNEYGEMINRLGHFVLEKLNCKRPIPLQGLDSEYQTVYQLLEQTVVAGEGNSMLLLGARGCGKTAVVESAISELASQHREDFHVVRLSGFLHTDDKVALREIWRQLGRDAGTEDEMNKTSSYADTMATLLALLSHPDELFGPSEDPEAMTTTKSVIIILDEFDLFSHHPRQTLLYNLFDIAQARKAPLAVLGLTTKVDVTENLEKRVKSRFSHRYVFLPRPRTFESFTDICRAALRVDESELQSSLLREDALKSEQGRALIQEWDTYLENLFDDPTLQTLLQQIFHRSKCPRDFFASALTPVSTFVLSSKHGDMQIPTAHSFASHSLSCPDPPPLPFPIPPNISSSTTSLPLSLLLTATRLTALHDPGLNSTTPQSSGTLTLSFATVYAEYVRLLTSAKASASSFGAAATPGRIWGKDVARVAWERLAEWGLVVPVSTGASTAAGDAAAFRVEISFEEVVDGMGAGGSGALGRWWRDT